MVYNEIHKDLFTVSDDYFLAHCISADFGMGAGIVVQFNKRFNMKHKLFDMFDGNIVNAWDMNGKTGNPQGTCIKVDRVLNLITKREYWSKPTYETFTQAILSMKNVALENNITKIAMPLIGCGLDKLKWNKVSEIIQNTFKDTNIEILVCIK